MSHDIFEFYYLDFIICHSSESNCFCLFESFKLLFPPIRDWQYEDFFPDGDDRLPRRRKWDGCFKENQKDNNVIVSYNFKNCECPSPFSNSDDLRHDGLYEKDTNSLMKYNNLDKNGEEQVDENGNMNIWAIEKAEIEFQNPDGTTFRKVIDDVTSMDVLKQLKMLPFPETEIGFKFK